MKFKLRFLFLFRWRLQMAVRSDHFEKPFGAAFSPTAVPGVLLFGFRFALRMVETRLQIVQSLVHSLEISRGRNQPDDLRHNLVGDLGILAGDLALDRKSV